jgi:hypothetical protein
MNDAASSTNKSCRATSQWFANLDKIKDDALLALQDVHFHPAICAHLLFCFCFLAEREIQPATASNLLFARAPNGVSRVSAYGGFLYPLFTTCHQGKLCLMIGHSRTY